jgi:PAS domain S-box-containing protein
LKATRLSKSRRPAPSGEVVGLRARLAEAVETLRAIRTGEVDTVVVAGLQGAQVFTLQGAEHAYRVLIECMNEGALMLTANKTILYANHCFASMVKCPLEQVMGGSMQRFLSSEDRAKVGLLLERADKAGSKIQVLLKAGDGSHTPAHISIRPLARNGFQSATFGLVVTNMTEARRVEELLRALTQRVVQAQEAERERVALELHDNITQLLCAVLVRCQTLADTVSPHDKPSKREAIILREMLGQTAEEVVRIARNLRPSILDELGLAAVLRDTCMEFAHRTGVSLKLVCVPLTERLPAEIELTLYRILQETLNNVEKHARARHVKVNLSRKGAFVQLLIRDDGIGFDPAPAPTKRNRKSGLGLLSMSERATYVGGAYEVTSVLRGGTETKVRVPMLPCATAASRIEL